MIHIEKSVKNLFLFLLLSYIRKDNIATCWAKKFLILDQFEEIKFLPFRSGSFRLWENLSVNLKTLEFKI